MKTNNFEVHAQKLQFIGNLLMYRRVNLGLSNTHSGGLGLLIGMATVFFSTSAGGNSNNLNPVAIYLNAELHKTKLSVKAKHKKNLEYIVGQT